MKLVIFGLSISSSWGNGHATLWRGLCSALAGHGHRIVFFEKDVSYYAAHRDYWEIPGGQLVLYEAWNEIEAEARRHLTDADVAIVTSFCPDALVAGTAVLNASRPLRVFYDLDSPCTLAALESNKPVAYVGPRGFRDYDLVLSYAGGRALDQLQQRLHAQRVAPLYGSVDPAVHRPEAPQERYRATISYLGTHSEDRVNGLRALFVDPARELPEKRFVIGGSQYDGQFPWLPNIYYLSHVASSDHPAFYCSAEYTLNVTRAAMAENGYCPSGRLFEAAACGAAMISDGWEGMEQFFEPDQEIIVARSTADVLDALRRSPAERAALGIAARERVLDCHTAEVRATELEAILASVDAPVAKGA